MLIKLKSLEWLIQTNLFIKITNSVLFRQTAVRCIMKMNKNNINNVFVQKAEYYESAIEAFSIYRNGALSSGIELFIWLSNLSTFTLLVLYDLWILQIDYEKSQRKYQQNYYARQSALLCFELFSDIPQNINDKYQKLLIDEIEDLEINSKATEIRKKFNKIRNDNESKFKEIRDLTAAHRDHDVSKLISIQGEMNNQEIIDFAFDYMKLIEELDFLLSDVIKYLNKEQTEIGNEKFYKKYT